MTLQSQGTQMMTPENCLKGFLVDDQWMGGVSPHPEQPGHYIAYIVAHETGQAVTAHAYDAIEKAVAALNGVRREWKFEPMKQGGCGGGNCKGGGCGGGGCAGGGCGGGACAPGATSETSSE